MSALRLISTGLRWTGKKRVPCFLSPSVVSVAKLIRVSRTVVVKLLHYNWIKYVQLFDTVITCTPIFIWFCPYLAGLHHHTSKCITLHHHTIRITLHQHSICIVFIPTLVCVSLYITTVYASLFITIIVYASLLITTVYVSLFNATLYVSLFIHTLVYISSSSPH